MARIVLAVFIAVFLYFLPSITVEAHHTGVKCGDASGQPDGRAVCLPLMDRSAAVRAIRDTKTITYCFDSRARNYPNFVSQTKAVAADFNSKFGIRFLEVSGTYQTSTLARDAGCQIWNSMPDVHGCAECGAWVHYLNWPVIVEYRWQAGYFDWTTTIVHEWLHILGLHEHYDDANFRSFRGTYGYWAHGIDGSPGTSTDSPTVMDFGTGVSKITAYDVKYACQSIDRQGVIFKSCGAAPDPEPVCGLGPTNQYGHAHDSCNNWWVSVTDSFVGIGNIYHYIPVAGFTGWEWGACTSWGGRDNYLAQISDTAGASTYVWWLNRWLTAPVC